MVVLCRAWIWLHINNKTKVGNISPVKLSKLNFPIQQESDKSMMFFTMDAKRMAQFLNKPVYDKNLLHGIKQFNLDPTRGLNLLVTGGFVKMEAESLAEFLFNQERLSKKQIGKSMSLVNSHLMNIWSRMLPRRSR